jgi:hypothetical protein
VSSRKESQERCWRQISKMIMGPLCPVGGKDQISHGR